ncbi:acyltransferase family protein, partial [Humibacter sp.]|uniref:acyltransferase family protein n=1 Tax=Humibacter sp. TaxID=1940291 RepID=UPI003F7FBA2F
MSPHTRLPISSPAPPSATAPERLPGLDGLRALAVVAVIAYHYVPTALPGGFIGVDVFFVISGFLITSLLIGSLGRRERLRSFWMRRARRLLPALVVLVLACCTAALFMGRDVLAHIGSQLAGALTFSSNWVYVALDQSYFAQASPQLFRNLWSLAVEEQFYLVWPLIVLALVAWMPRRGRATAPLVLAAASVATMAVLYRPGADPSRVYYGTDTHFFGLALGAALAFALDRQRRWDLYGQETVAERFARRAAPVVGVLALVGLAAYAVFVHDRDAFNYDGGLALVSVLAVALVWAATRPASALGTALDVRPLRAIGVRSYGLYLWHWPVLVLVGAVASAVSVGSASVGSASLDSASWAVPSIALAISAVATALSYRFVETPIRRRGFRTLVGPFTRTSRARPALFGGACVACAALLVGVVGTSAAAVEGMSGTAAEQQVAAGRRAIEQAEHQAPAPSHAVRSTDAAGAPASPGPTPTPSPTPSASVPAASPASAPVVAPAPRDGSDITAIGDSVMLASAPALLRAFPGISIDAVVSRSPRDAPALL